MAIVKTGDEVRVRRQITVINELGLHARPAAEFVRRANGFRSEIWILIENKRFSAFSLIEVMRANLNQGAVATLEAIGPDALEALECLEKIVAEGFGEI
ncbi:MAG TPA: HPr family phosphocarrier protein [Candidatus Udaeobacter sp.]|nr:HPr family phosphocarrier protein [Candidatus Udaeobacter sp.]